jgi:1-pyrroline-5-carboxylate dehydrogenase
MVRQFRNESFTDFSNQENRQKMTQALADVEARLGREWSLVINGKRLKSKDQFFSHNPADPDQVIGIFQRALPEHGEQAIQSALRTFNTWRKTPADRRAEYCFRVADIMRSRRFELAAWMILEVGKSWVEADADVAEAIDLVEFYGHEVLRYAQPQPLVKIPTEESELHYIPLGVGIVIPPWNFPVAILAGMTASAFAAGNTVVLKPSSDSPACAKRFVEVLEEAGLPPGVVNLLTGPGSEIGQLLVQHPQTRFVSFTGSKEVGTRISEQAARVMAGQRWLKRVVAEMGGKNAIIIDSQADLDRAVQGVVVSAFGYSGQKCSACSRAIVLADVYEQFLTRLCDRTKTIAVGPPRDPQTFMGPVINLRAMAKILEYTEIGRREGRLLLGGNQLPRPGYFVEPTIIADVDPNATIAQEEIFGPVLAVIKAQDFGEAIDIANNSEYGLTGSVYTTNPQKMERAKQDFHVGNLYFNRKSTGALVGVHPFGGFNMSGTDSKAGGRDYLLLFTQAKSISRYAGS